MKTYYSLLIIMFCASIQAQFYISPGTTVSVDDGGGLYSNEDVFIVSEDDGSPEPLITAEGKLEFLGDGDLYLDGGFNIDQLITPRPFGTLSLGDATLHIGSGEPNSDGSHSFVFNSLDNTAKNVVFDKVSGTITVDNTVGGFLNITETLTSHGSGTLDAGDRIVMKSTSVENTAVVRESTGGTINEIRVERFIPADRAFRMMASPVNQDPLNPDRSLFSDWQQGGLYPGETGYEPGVGTHITGSGVDDLNFTMAQAGVTAAGFDKNGSGAPSMYEFSSDGLNQWLAIAENSDFGFLTNTSNIKLQINRPYFILIRGDRSIDLSINDTNTTTTVLRQTGSLAIGDANADFDPSTASSFNDGFVAVANPYQSPVDFREALQDVPGVFENTIWFYDQTDSNSGAFNAITDLDGSFINTLTGSNVTPVLQPGQSIFVKVQESPSVGDLIFSESHKVTDPLIDIYSKSEEPINEGFVRLGVYDTKHKAFEDLAFDGVILRFDEKYENGKDASDAQKLFSNNVNMAIEMDDMLLTVDSRKTPKRLDQIINLNITYPGNRYKNDLKFSVDLEGFAGFDNGIILWDKYLDTYTTLEDKQIINFSVDHSIPETIDVNRFAFVFESATLSITDEDMGEIAVYPNPMTSNFIDVQFSQVSTEDTTIEMFDLLGKKVMTRKFESLDRNVRLDNLNLSSGVYLMNVKQGNLAKTFKIIKQ